MVSKTAAYDIRFFLSYFMNCANDDLFGSGLAIRPDVGFTHHGLCAATLHAYQYAMENEPDVNQYNRLWRKYYGQTKKKDASIEKQLLEGFYNPNIYLRAFFGLLEMDRSKFVVTKDSNPYCNRAIGISNGRTCSAPYIVLLYNLIAVSLLDKPRVIGEGGTGCGYHASNTLAIFPDAHVYTWEVPTMICRPNITNTLKDIDLEKRTDYISRINVISANCLTSPPEDGLIFDEFYFTFAIPEEQLLKPYLDHLKEGGILIAPINNNLTEGQNILRVYFKKGGIRTTDLCFVGFSDAILS